MTIRRLVFSPHADDAVLSCYGALGPGSAVVTVFAGVPEDPGLLTDWDRALGAADSRELALERRAEDLRSFAPLGLVPEQWPYLDGQYRPGETPRQLSADLAARVRAGAPVGAGPAREVWLPAGLLGHPDHVLVRDTGLAACAELADEGLPPRVVLYAEYPYQLFQISNHLRAAGTRDGFAWTNDRPEPLAAWAAEQFPRATAGRHRAGETRLPEITAAAKAAAIRAHATQVDVMDRQVRGQLLNLSNLELEYWWPLHGARAALSDLAASAPAPASALASASASAPAPAGASSAGARNGGGR
ncbi:PIG-L deacetylase family protein [Kitasatospora fiedleri]|uniref:PIG-L deacetylase family protein n=1 Tax=Kitasatospora fiedleri TaxID=2991545 RepID=UPI00249BC11F|nr:PIG-L family deacetylase [Kitasatospora fiedleri]